MYRPLLRFAAVTAGFCGSVWACSSLPNYTIRNPDASVISDAGSFDANVDRKVAENYRYIFFVTANAFSGNFALVPVGTSDKIRAEANKRCSVAWTTEHKEERRWRALLWLRAEEPPTNNLKSVDGGWYRPLGANGGAEAPQFASANEIFAVPLKNPFLDEKGQAVTGFAWSGGDAINSAADCFLWQSNKFDEFGHVTLFSDASTDWFGGAEVACDKQGRLICFEQP